MISVSPRSHRGVIVVCPAYLGRHGFCLELALRPGVQHSAKETDFNLERAIPMAQRLSAAGPKAPILARLDSSFDSAALMRGIEPCNRSGQPQVHQEVQVIRQDAQTIRKRLAKAP